MEYIERVLTNLKAKNADQPEFIQAVEEVLESLEPVIKAHPEYEDMACVLFSLFIVITSCCALF